MCKRIHVYAQAAVVYTKHACTHECTNKWIWINEHKCVFGSLFIAHFASLNNALFTHPMNIACSSRARAAASATSSPRTHARARRQCELCGRLCVVCLLDVFVCIWWLVGCVCVCVCLSSCVCVRLTDGWKNRRMILWEHQMLYVCIWTRKCVVHKCIGICTCSFGWWERFIAAGQVLENEWQQTAWSMICTTRIRITVRCSYSSLAVSVSTRCVARHAVMAETLRGDSLATSGAASLKRMRLCGKETSMKQTWMCREEDWWKDGRTKQINWQVNEWKLG